MVNDGQSRIKTISNRLIMLEKDLCTLDELFKDNQKKLLLEAVNLLHCFFKTSKIFYENTKMFQSLFQDDTKLLETLFFHSPCILASGSNAYHFFQKNRYASTVVLYGWKEIPNKKDNTVIIR